MKGSLLVVFELMRSASLVGKGCDRLMKKPGFSDCNLPKGVIFMANLYKFCNTIDVNFIRCPGRVSPSY